MNEASVQLLASVLGAVGSVSAAIASFVTVYLVSRDFSARFSPKIDLEPRSFEIKVNRAALDDFFRQEPNSIYKYVNGGETNYTESIVNFGKGSAHDVSLSLSFHSLDQIRGILAKMEAEADVSVWHEPDGWGQSIYVGGKCIGGVREIEGRYSFIPWVGGSGNAPTREKTHINPSLQFVCLCCAYWLMHRRMNHDIVEPDVQFDFSTDIQYSDDLKNKWHVSIDRKVTVKGGRYKDDMSDGITLLQIDNVKRIERRVD